MQKITVDFIGFLIIFLGLPTLLLIVESILK